MNKFVDLFQSDDEKSAKQCQDDAESAFPRLLREHGIDCQTESLGQKTSIQGDRVVIGVAASFSLSDLQLMDEIAEKIKEDNVMVFDVAMLQEMNDFDRIIPGVAPVHQTPVVGIWENGSLVVKKSGKEARDFLRERYSGK